MEIQIHSDHNIKENLEFLKEKDQFQKIVQDNLAHFQKHITRVNVFFSDENGNKNELNDKRCLIEARVSGIRPYVAHYHANSLLLALGGAALKLKHELEHNIGIN